MSVSWTSETLTARYADPNPEKKKTATEEKEKVPEK